jgi:hypothetical protein
VYAGNNQLINGNRRSHYNKTGDYCHDNSAWRVGRILIETCSLRCEECGTPYMQIIEDIVAKPQSTDAAEKANRGQSGSSISIHWQASDDNLMRPGWERSSSNPGLHSIEDGGRSYVRPRT